MSDTLISVMLSVYNREHYLTKCIDSILAQKNVRTEIIIVDDGSSDGAEKICDEYAARFSNIRVIHQENKGLSSARNVGLDHATGDFLFFIDSDDYLPKDSLETLMELQAEHDADCVIGNYDLYNDDYSFSRSIKIPEKYKNKLLTDREICELLLYTNKTNLIIFTWGKLFKRQVWDGIRFPERVTMSEDQFVFAELAKRIRRLYFTGKIAYHQVLATSSITRSCFETNTFSRKNLYHSEGVLLIIDYLMEKGYYDIALFKFGMATRHLIHMKRYLKDKESVAVIKQQYKEYCQVSRKLESHFGKKVRSRLALFRINLDLYAFVRNAMAKR